MATGRERTRQRVLLAARKVLLVRGVRGTRASDIYSDVPVSQGAFLHAVPGGLEEVLECIFLCDHESLWAEVTRLFENIAPIKSPALLGYQAAIRLASSMEQDRQATRLYFALSGLLLATPNPTTVFNRLGKTRAAFQCWANAQPCVDGEPLTFDIVFGTCMQAAQAWAIGWTDDPPSKALLRQPAGGPTKPRRNAAKRREDLQPRML